MLVTLKNLAVATPQQVFDQVTTHLRTQKVQSKKPDPDCPTVDMCAYRGTGNLKCAAGALIADDEYKPEMDFPGGPADGTSWGCLIKRELVPSTVHDAMISALQQAHDSDYTPIETGLMNVARDYNLQLTPL